MSLTGPVASVRFWKKVVGWKSKNNRRTNNGFLNIFLINPWKINVNDG
jgi:hypothetical protein